MGSDVVAAVDVGTGSARAGLFDREGRPLCEAEHAIEMNCPRSGHAEHDSEDVWRAVCRAMRSALRAAGVDPADVAAIAFDATCSIVVRGPGGGPVTVSADGDPRWDTIAWLDHRAVSQVERGGALAPTLNARAGGRLSPEMALPKLLWLKENLPESWASSEQVFDLADFLSWRASGSTARSQCTLACKWGYFPERAAPWPLDELSAIGLGDIVMRCGLPQSAVPVGTDLGGLTPSATLELGLTPRTRVGAGLVDAHAGALGTIGAFAGDLAELRRRAALVAGTSSCVMALSPEPRSVRGIWGPYLGATLPRLWLSEGGQSASGALLDHLIRIHGGGRAPDAAVHAEIWRRIGALRQTEGPDLGHRIHVLPDFHGNRSPFADPRALGAILGLSLDSSFDELCRLYFRACVAIALGIRQIVETMNAAGAAIDTLHLAGGFTREPGMVALYADATGCDIVVPEAGNAMLRGSALAAATAAGWHGDLAGACRAMTGQGTVLRPDPSARERHRRDYEILKRMQRHRIEIDRIDGEYQS